MADRIFDAVDFALHYLLSALALGSLIGLVLWTLSR
jgi:uncharacterized membrane protein